MNNGWKEEMFRKYKKTSNSSHLDGVAREMGERPGTKEGKILKRKRLKGLKTRLRFANYDASVTLPLRRAVESTRWGQEKKISMVHETRERGRSSNITQL